MTTGIELIAAERTRQIEVERFDASHDWYHPEGTLAVAAACYALPTAERLMALECDENGVPEVWPWEPKMFKPTPGDRKRELIKAGALIAAELDKILLEEDFQRYQSEHKQ